MLKDHILSTITLPDTVTTEYYDSIVPFSVESIWQLAYRDLTHSNVNIENESRLSELCFNSQTVFPDKLSQAAQAVLESGKKNPLSNHTGLTGKGIKAAVIDRPIPVDHIEFRDGIQYMEVIPGHEKNSYIDFHGTTCASYLCGKTCGVAKGVELLYYAIPNNTQPIETYYEWQLQALKKIVEYNRRHDDPIRVGQFIRPVPVQSNESEERTGERAGVYRTYFNRYHDVYAQLFRNRSRSIYANIWVKSLAN